MLSQLKKLALVGALSLAATAGMASASGAAYAATTPPIVPTITKIINESITTDGLPEVTATTSFPFCYGIADTLHDGAKACVDYLNFFPSPAGETGVFFEAGVSVTYCVLGSCTTKSRSTGLTGAGVNISNLIPVVTYTTIPVTVPKVCVKTTCTGGVVNVPFIKEIDLLPGSGPTVTVCASVLGCTSPLFTLQPISTDTVANFIASTSAS